MRKNNRLKLAREIHQAGFTILGRCIEKMSLESVLEKGLMSVWKAAVIGSL